MLCHLKQTYFTRVLKQNMSLIVFGLMFVFSGFIYADTIRIGLRAHIGIDKGMQQWKKTADYLSEKIPEHKFIMIPIIGLPELMREVESNQFDFVLTNPSSYVEMKLRFGASAILTLRNKRQGKPYTKFGSVIFTRKDSDIYEIKDLKNKRIVAVSERAFGGWRVALRELLKEGFDAYHQTKQVSFSGGIQRDVVSIVQLGNADAGVVRTDMLERLAKSGTVKLEDFRIINSKTKEGFPFYHSTRLYPEWPFIKMRDTSSALSKRVALALLTMPSDHPATIAGKYVGWTVPEDYQPVHNLMKELHVGPYVNYHENYIDYFQEKYLVPFIIVIFVFSILFLLTIYILSINRKLVHAKNQQDRLMDELEERVTERTKELIIEKEKAEQASKAKTEFLSSMSHELRTPMNAVLGFAQILEYDVAHQKMDLVKDNINEILLAGRHLLELVNDVLDLAKIETGKYDVDLQNIKLTEVLNGVVKLLSVLANKYQISIISNYANNEAITIVADLRSFKQVLINIITNAIKYNKEKGSVAISVEKFNDGECKIDISDTGEGIAEDSLKKIFEPFERVSTRTNIEGSGVGLAITKNLIEIMNGKISVESALGEGSTFSLIFKLSD